MYAMIVSSDLAFTPAAAAKTNKAVILIQSGIHSGEIEGKDTALMLVRDMVITRPAHQAAWLKKAIFIVIPVFNVDGHEARSPFNRPNQNGPATLVPAQQAQLAQPQSRLCEGGHAGDARMAKALPRLDARFHVRQPCDRRSGLPVRRDLGHGAPWRYRRTRTRLGE